MKKILTSFLALLAACVALRADTSYLLVQAPFGSGGAIETYKWKVLYQPGSLTTGLDLLNAVFGVATDSGTTFTAGGAPYSVYSAGNSNLGVSYIDFAGDGSSLFTISFSIQGTAVTMDNDYDPSWSSHVAGGSGSGHGGAYANGSWTYSDDGVNTRELANNSFDGWVFGSGFPVTIADTASPGDNEPMAANFASATVVNVVPEPGSIACLALGALVLLRRRRRE